MKKIEANIVDVVRNKIYPARISFDTCIQKIQPIANTPDIYILPGLVDAHVHIESSMLPPSEFARLAVRHGTLAAVSDPHEIANVLGVAGINFMLENATHVPFEFVFGAPSCVPATLFETSGAVITSGIINQLFFKRKVSYLSEVMNFPGVIHEDPDIMEKISIAWKYGKPIDGHAPGLSGNDLRKYVQAGISTDHECTTLKEADEKIRLGMKILIRHGSAAKNFDTLYPLIRKYPDKVMFCTDDFHPDDLLRGHINQLLANGIAKKLDLFSLLHAAIVNPMVHYQIDLGLVQLGDPADFIVVDDLKNFSVRQSFYHGICTYDRMGEELGPVSTSPAAVPSEKPRKYNKSLFGRGSNTKLPNCFGAAKISVSDIKVIATSSKMRIIQAFDGEIVTKQLFHEVQKDSLVRANVKEDMLKIIVLNRYRPAKPAVAFVRGFGLNQGALVSTIAHDSHHIIAVGCDDISLVTAINHIIDLKGGLAAYYNNTLTDLKLDIAGLMSSASGEEVAHRYEVLNNIASTMGCALTSPFMTLSFMALLVVPELKLSDKGLFDVDLFEETNLFV